MKRYLAVIAFVAVSWPGTATAKGMQLDHVELSGPAVAGTLRVSRTEFGIVRSQWSPAAVALERLFAGGDENPPPGELGPRFELVYAIESYLNPPVRIHRYAIDLYPYAEDGPFGYVRPGQERFWPVEDPGTIRAGWHPVPDRIVDNLRAAGLPSRAVAREATRETEASWPVAGAALFALAALAWLQRPRDHGSVRAGRGRPPT